MRSTLTRRFTAVPLLCFFLAGCGGGDKSGQPAPPPGGDAAAGGLSAFQLENGIGPITAAVELGDIDKEKAEAGKKVFETMCTACHKMQEKYVGPPLGDVTTRRTGAFIMNQILDPQGMYEKHPAVKQMLAEYMTQMPNLGLTQDQAREVLEYLRTQAPAHAGN